MYHLAEIIRRGPRPPWQRLRRLFWPILLLALHIGCLGATMRIMSLAGTRPCMHQSSVDPALCMTCQVQITYLPGA